jgi:predicted nucleotidyltransferase
MRLEVPPRVEPAVRAIEGLARYERYRAALLFGSLARGAAEPVDVDAVVVVDEAVPCQAINHPRIGGVKLDVSFRSRAQLRAETEEAIRQGTRVPMVAESIVLFDKDGELTRLREEARRVERPAVDPSEWDWLQFLIYHEDDKAHRVGDPAAALLAMEEGLPGLLQFHYRLRRRWWVSSKRRLADLRGWDPEMAALVEGFVGTAEVGAKLRLWEAILERVVEPMGGRKAVEETSCRCGVCRADLAALEGAPNAFGRAVASG